MQPHGLTELRFPTIFFITLALFACSDPVEPSFDVNVYNESDVGSDVHDVTEDVAPPGLEVYCPIWCDTVSACGLVGYDEAQCAEICEAVFEADFLEPCTTCLEATSCEELRSTCFSPDTACHQPPSVSYLFNVGGFDEPFEGRPGYGRIVTYDGLDIDAFAEGMVVEGKLSLSFGTVLTTGMHYRLFYYVDADDDGVCDASTDPSYSHEIILNEPAAVRYEFPGVPEETEPQVCDEFTSTGELCERRCTRLQSCDALSDSVDACIIGCEDELSAAFLNRCILCLEAQSCADHERACTQTGGVCDEEHTPAETEFLFSGTQFGDYEGHKVYAFVEDLFGRPLSPLLDREITEGAFFFHFGLTVWMNGTYLTVFFIDLDDTGRCDPGDPGWAIVSEVGNSILHYELHQHTPEAMLDVCSRVP